MPRASSVLVLTICVASLAACAQATGGSSERSGVGTAGTAVVEGPPPREGGAPINWDAPFPRGLTVDSVRDAARLLPFSVNIPDFDVQPALIQVTNPREFSPEDREIAFVYEFPEYGTVWVVEKASHLGPSDLQGKGNDPNVPREAFEIVAVRGTEALLISWNGVGSIRWIEDGVLYRILGPSTTPDIVRELAEQV